MCVSLTTEGLVPPGSDDHASVLTLVDVRLDGLTQHRPGSVQSTQVKQTVLEEALRYKHTQTHRLIMEDKSNWIDLDIL